MLGVRHSKDHWTEAASLLDVLNTLHKSMYGFIRRYTMDRSPLDPVRQLMCDDGPRGKIKIQGANSKRRQKRVASCCNFGRLCAHSANPAHRLPSLRLALHSRPSIGASRYNIALGVQHRSRIHLPYTIWHQPPAPAASGINSSPCTLSRCYCVLTFCRICFCFDWFRTVSIAQTATFPTPPTSSLLKVRYASQGYKDGSRRRLAAMSLHRLARPRRYI
jgi:hypothetical protein